MRRSAGLNYIDRFGIASLLAVARRKARSDQTDPAIIGDQLYWVSGFTIKEVVALLVIVDQCYRHSIRDCLCALMGPGGKRLAFVTGDYRLVDWALHRTLSRHLPDAMGAARQPRTS